MSWYPCCRIGSSNAYVEYSGTNYGGGGGVSVCCGGGGTPSLNTTTPPDCNGFGQVGPDPCGGGGALICGGDGSACSGAIVSIISNEVSSGGPNFCVGDGSWSTTWTWEVVYSCSCSGANLVYASENFSFTISYSNSVPPCSGVPGGASLYSNIARFTDWGFQIPEEAQIIGIEANINRQVEDNAILASDSIVKLVKNHRTTGKNKAQLDTIWNTENTTIKYGNMVDMWGIDNINSNDINSEGFGIAIEVENASDKLNSNAFLNSIQISIYYKINDEVLFEDKILDWDGAIYPIFN